METQNITLAVPKDMLLKVKMLAFERHTSVSDLLVEALQMLVEQEDAYAQARLRHLELLERAADLGTRGQVTTRRDELHARE